LQRLGNPAIADELTRLCRRGATKMPSYLLPSIEESIAAGRPHPLMTLAVAGWFRFLTGEDYAGRPIDVEGPFSAEFVELVRRHGADPTPLLQVRDVFGALVDAPAFVRDLHVTSEALRAGPRETMATWLAIRAGGR
jgi:fructuronate reductase/mannitol 2-dehydrogenase